MDIMKGNCCVTYYELNYYKLKLYVGQKWPVGPAAYIVHVLG